MTGHCSMAYCPRWLEPPADGGAVAAPEPLICGSVGRGVRRRMGRVAPAGERREVRAGNRVDCRWLCRAMLVRTASRTAADDGETELMVKLASAA